jgi:hypothetical protein
LRRFLFFCPFGLPKLSERVVDLACTRSIHRFCIPKTLCGEPSPVSTQFDESSCCTRKYGAIRSLLRWLFLHRRLRSRQRGSASFDVSGVAPDELIKSRGRCSFLSKQPRLALRLTLASLSASAPDVPGSGFPLLLPSNGVSPPPPHLPVPVKMPVSNLDCETSLHPLFSMSSRKYFNYCPYSIRGLWKTCG